MDVLLSPLVEYCFHCCVRADTPLCVRRACVHHAYASACVYVRVRVRVGMGDVYAWVHRYRYRLSVAVCVRVHIYITPHLRTSHAFFTNYNIYYI